MECYECEENEAVRYIGKFGFCIDCWIKGLKQETTEILKVEFTCL